MTTSPSLPYAWGGSSWGSAQFVPSCHQLGIFLGGEAQGQAGWAQ